jgi:dGTPase
MYYSKNVIKKTKKGKKIINDLFAIIIKNPKKYIKSDDYKKIKKRMVCDFIAGMTDRYAINLHNKIK